MWAIALKEFRQLRRDRRTLAMMIFLPLVLLVVFGYAASFDVSEVPTIVVGPGANTIAPHLPSVLDVQSERPDEGRADAEDILRGGEAVVVVVADPRAPEVFVDGSELFSARAVVTGLAGAGGLPAGIPKPKVHVLFNPGLETSAVMIPAIIGLILVFVGTVATSLGVVRERQAGTLEQLAVMPFRARDVFVGKVAPYFAVGILDMAIVVAAGLGLFGVPFRGSVLTFALGALLFLFVTLGVGVLISTVSENQGQAIQLSIMTLLPQVLLSGRVIAERSGPLVRRIGLVEARLRLVGQLSGGMRHKLALAVGLLHRPELLMLDEPTTGVDPVDRADLWRLISSAAADGAAVLFATTYLDEAERAGEVLALDAGTTLARGTPEDVVRRMT